MRTLLPPSNSRTWLSCTGKDCMRQLGVTVVNRIHITRLKLRLLSALPIEEMSVWHVRRTSPQEGMWSRRQWCHVFGASSPGGTHRQICLTQSSHLMDLNFQTDCQRNAVPLSLLALVHMILDGVIIKHQTQMVHTTTTTAAFFNHPVIGVLQRETWMKCAVGMGDAVCPPKIRHGLLTTGMVDNIDNNPTSAIAKDSFHDTGISLMQHPSHTRGGSDRGAPVNSPDTSTSTKSVALLPSTYDKCTTIRLENKEVHCACRTGSSETSQPPDFCSCCILVRWLRDKLHRYIYMPDKSFKFGMLLDKLIYLKNNPCSKEFAHYLTIKSSKIQHGRHSLKNCWLCDNWNW